MRNFKIAICIVIIASLFSGCMNTHHLKDLVIVEGMGIDQEQSQVHMFVQTLNVAINSTSEGLKGNNTIITDSKGDTILATISNLSKTISKKLFFGQNKVVIFGKDVAEKYFEDKLDFFLRSTDSRLDVAVCISDTSAEDVIQSKENDAVVPCESILYLIKNSEKSGLGAYVTTNDLLNAYKDKTSDMYMPVLEMRKGDKSARVKGIGLFDDTSLQYITDHDETLGFMLINSEVDQAVIEVNDKKLGNIGVELSSVKTKKYITIENGTILFNVKIKCKIMINEIEKGIITTLDEENMKTICRLVENEINFKCKKAFDACTGHKSDCIRVGEYLAQYEPEIYREIADKWDTYFPGVKINVSSHTNLKKISDNTIID